MIENSAETIHIQLISLLKVIIVDNEVVAREKIDFVERLRGIFEAIYEST